MWSQNLTGCSFVLPVTKLVQEIEQHQCLRSLCLEGNTLGVDAARAIAKALESKDTLEVLISSLFIFRRQKNDFGGYYSTVNKRLMDQ